MRLANLRPSSEGVEVCIKPANEDYRRPLFRDGGLACPTGAAFKQVTSAFSAPASEIDVRVLPSGTTKCEGTPPIAEGRVSLVPDAVTTLAILGGGGEPTQVKGYRDFAEKGASGGAFVVPIRFINAIGGIGPLFLGIAGSGRLPTTLTLLFRPEGVPFGGVLAEGPTQSGLIDAHGYLAVDPIAKLTYGASRQDSKDALLVAPTPPVASTVFAIGSPDDRRFPVRALTCADGAVGANGSPFVTCTESDPASFSIDVFFTGLYGLFSPVESERRAVLPGAVSGRNSDFMCLTEIHRAADRQAVIDRAKSAFPYSYQTASDLDTPFSDPRGLDGTVPQAPTTPPCKGYEAGMNELYQCMKDNCSTKPDGSGVATDAACTAEKCATQLGTLAFSEDPGARRCHTCAVSEMLSQEISWDDAAQSCTTNPKAGFIFRGQTSILMLSKYPLKRTEVHQLPSTGFRRAILAATAELEGGQEVDLYCPQFSIEQTQLYPYTGLYGTYDPAAPERGWYDEQAVQVKQLVDFVKRRSQSNRAIIAGDFEASQAVPESNIVDRNVPIIERLQTEFQQAVPEGYVPTCTLCEPPKNPLSPSGTVGYWEQRIFLYNFGENATISAGTFFTDFMVPLPGGETAPLSETFGFTARTLRD